jgi:hypothetical protein
MFSSMAAPTVEAFGCLAHRTMTRPRPRLARGHSSLEAMTRWGHSSPKATTSTRPTSAGDVVLIRPRPILVEDTIPIRSRPTMAGDAVPARPRMSSDGRRRHDSPKAILEWETHSQLAQNHPQTGATNTTRPSATLRPSASPTRNPGSPERSPTCWRAPRETVWRGPDRAKLLQLFSTWIQLLGGSPVTYTNIFRV